MSNQLKGTQFQKLWLPLVCQSQNELQINSEALSFLSNLPSKHCHVLTIAGRAKTGKSTLMNHIIHKFDVEAPLQQYFPVSDNLGGGTKGINILNTYVTLEDDSILLFLDVEGMGRFTNSESYESKLFAVSLLLSTTLLYNSIGPIDQQSLQNLSVFIEIGKMFEKSILKNQEILGNDSGLPSLFMVLRDFSLKLENKQGFDVTSKQYMQTALEEQKGGSQTIFHKNRIRRSIKQLFKQRNCQTLVLPSDELPLRFKSTLRSQFQNDLTRLLKKIKAHITERGHGNRLLLPSQMALYIREILNSVNLNICVPRFGNILSIVYQKQIHSVKEKFKESVHKLSRQFECQADDAEQIINSVKISGEFQSFFVENQIAKLESLNVRLNQSYFKARQQIEQFIKKQRNNNSISIGNQKNQSILDAQELKFLQSTKTHKQDQINKKIQELRQAIETNKKMFILGQLQVENAAQFRKNIQQLCSIQEEKQLEQRYRTFIYALRERCNKINSKQFQTGILKCEITFLRRKLELRERAQSKGCPTCKLGLTQSIQLNGNTLRDRLNSTNACLNQISFSCNIKNTTAQSKQQGQRACPSKSFYVPYIILSDPLVMNVEIVKTLIKQDNKFNNYIEYVIEVVIMERRWVFNRKWKDFNELHSILTSLFDHRLPQFANAQLGLKNGLGVHKEEVEERRKNLEQYLRKLLEIEPIRNSRIMQKFLKINKEYVPTL